jgi:hypothetical protein
MECRGLLRVFLDLMFHVQVHLVANVRSTWCFLGCVRRMCEIWVECVALQGQWVGHADACRILSTYQIIKAAHVVILHVSYVHIFHADLVAGDRQLVSARLGIPARMVTRSVHKYYLTSHRVFAVRITR